MTSGPNNPQQLGPVHQFLSNHCPLVQMFSSLYVDKDKEQVDTMAVKWLLCQPGKTINSIPTEEWKAK